MNVFYLSITVPKTQPAAIAMDLSCVLATLGKLKMEKFVKVIK
jgi:hypothetical protein